MCRLGTHHLAVGALLVLCSITSIVHAAIQSVHLEPGWNLVFFHYDSERETAVPKVSSNNKSGWQAQACTRDSPAWHLPDAKSARPGR